MKKFGALITNGAMIALSVFMFVFMSQPYFTFKMLGQETSNNGYYFVENISTDKLTDDGKLVAVATLVLIIVASLLIVFALLNLLASFNLIKSKQVAKILSVLTVLLALVAVVVSICALTGAANIGKKTSGSLGDFKFTEGSAGWGVILNLILSIAALIVALFDALIAFKSSKTKKRRK